MRIVLDENLPRTLKRSFAFIHVVTTVQELGFAGLTNGHYWLSWKASTTCS